MTINLEVVGMDADVPLLPAGSWLIGLSAGLANVMNRD